MSEFINEDWKLKARTVVKLYRKNTNTCVSLSVKDDDDIANCATFHFVRSVVIRDVLAGKSESRDPN